MDCKPDSGLCVQKQTTYTLALEESMSSWEDKQWQTRHKRTGEFKMTKHCNHIHHFYVNYPQKDLSKKGESEREKESERKRELSLYKVSSLTLIAKTMKKLYWEESLLPFSSLIYNHLHLQYGKPMPQVILSEIRWFPDVKNHCHSIPELLPELKWATWDSSINLTQMLLAFQYGFYAEMDFQIYSWF